MAAARNKHGLTPKQEEFAVLYATSGLSASDAYRRAYNAGNMDCKTIWSKASELRKHGKVAARIDGFLEQLDLAQILRAGKQVRDTIEHRDEAAAERNWTAVASLDRQLNEMSKALVSRVEISDHRDPDKLVASLSHGDPEVEAALRKVIGTAGGFTEQ